MYKNITLYLFKVLVFIKICSCRRARENATLYLYYSYCTSIYITAYEPILLHIYIYIYIYYLFISYTYRLLCFNESNGMRYIVHCYLLFVSVMFTFDCGHILVNNKTIHICNYVYYSLISLHNFKKLD